MTESLRAKVVAAVAEELEADCNAEAALDAALACLTENAVVWERAVPAFSAKAQRFGAIAVALLSVLSEPTERND